MSALPGIRAVAVDTPSVVVSGLPFRVRSGRCFATRSRSIPPRRCRAALASPAREALRADAAAFPPYAGGSVHVPMETLVVPGSD